MQTASKNGPHRPRPVPGRAGSSVGLEWPLVELGVEAESGSFALVELEPGSELDALPGGAGERAYMLLEGELALTGEPPPQRVSAGMAIYVPEGVSAGAITKEAGATLVAIGTAGGQRPGGSSRGAAQAFTIASVDDELVHDPARGFFDMRTRWLVNGRSRGSAVLAVGLNTFEPGARHELHRHHRAEEFFFLLEGEGAHLTEHGDVWLRAGEIVYVPADEWHGFVNRGDRPSRSVFGYFGTNDVAVSGYELYPPRPH